MGSELIITSDGNSLTVDGQTYPVTDSEEASVFISLLGWDFIKRIATSITPYLIENAHPKDNIGSVIQAVLTLKASVRNRLLAQASDVETLKKSDLDGQAVEELTLAVIIDMARKPGVYTLSEFESPTVTETAVKKKEKRWYGGNIRVTRRGQ